MFGDGSADYVTRTEEAVGQWERRASEQRDQGRRAGRRLLLGIAAAVILKRPWYARRRDQRF